MFDPKVELFAKDNTGGEEKYVPWKMPSLRDALPEDIRGNDAFKDVKGLDDMARRFTETIGKVRNAPGSPDEYQFDPGDLKELLSQEEYDAFRPVAHKLGLDPQQFAGLVGYQLQRAKEQNERIARARQEVEAALLKKHGEENWKAGKTQASKALGIVDPSYVEYADSAGWTSDPVFIEMMMAYGKAISEGAIHPGGGAGSNMQRTADGRPMLDFSKSMPR